LLALSLGLNAGLAYVEFSRRAEGGVPPPPPGEVARAGERSGPAGELADPTRLIRERLERLGEELHLSEEQTEAMAEALGEVLPELNEGREKIRALRMQMRDEYLQPDIDEAEIHRLRRETMAIQSRLDSLMVETMLKEARVLTPEQRETYFELMPFGDRGKHGPGPHRGRKCRGGAGQGPRR